MIAADHEAIILAAAITAGPEREAKDPEAILRVNLLAQTPVLIAARRAGVKRIINLSSAAAYGTSAFRNAVLDEQTDATRFRFTPLPRLRLKRSPRAWPGSGKPISSACR